MLLSVHFYAFSLRRKILLSGFLQKIYAAYPLPPGIPTRKSVFRVWLGVALLKLGGWQFEGQFPDEKKLLVAVAPHTSNWDFVWAVSVMLTLRLRLSFMAKSSLFVWPFGWLMAKMGGIAISRDKSYGVVAQMVRRFNQEDALFLALAPEGTRRRTKQWKTGFLQIAHKADVPVLLIGVDYKRKRFVIGPCRKISDNTDAELRETLRFFASISGKYPEFCDTSGHSSQEK